MIHLIRVSTRPQEDGRDLHEAHCTCGFSTGELSARSLVVEAADSHRVRAQFASMIRNLESGIVAEGGRS